MKLRYILGSSGSGKTETCLNELTENKNTDKSLIYIVPEQFSLESEKKLIEKSNCGAISNIQVLSFKRLAYHVFSETGLPQKKILEETGKLMLIRKVISESSNKLTFFNTVSEKQGFADDMFHIISEFFQYNITPDILKASAENLPLKEGLYKKIHDIYEIYKTYLKYIKNDYISTDETLDLLSEKIPSSNFIENALIWIDGFNGFTPQEYEVISELSKKAAQINITLCINQRACSFPSLKNYDYFYETKNTINKLNKIAANNNMTLLEPLYLQKNHRFENNNELRFLEKNFFNINTQYNLPVKNIEILNSKNKYTEIDDIARKILSLIRDNNYKYKDIAVLLASSEYESPLRSCFNHYSFPYFIDVKRDISFHPLVELIRSALNIIITNFSYDSVFRFLKTGLTPLDSDEINILENYVLAYGIKNQRWHLPHWSYGFSSNSEFNEDDVNYFKDCFTDCIYSFTKEFNSSSKYSVKQITASLYNLIIALDTPKTLDIWIDEAREKGNKTVENEHTQIWNIVMSVFDKIADIFGSEKMTLKEYSKIIESGFSSITMGLIPPSQDEILIGNLKRTIFPNIKALFVLGVNDGVLPSFQEENNIFSDNDRNLLNQYGIELSSTSTQKFTEEQFLIYSCMTKPNEKLFLSYSKGNLDGKPLRPSSLIPKLKRLFPKLTEQEISVQTNITLPVPTFEKLIQPLLQYSNGIDLAPEYKDIYNWFSSSNKFSKKLTQIENGLFKSNEENYLNSSTAKSLYKNTLSASASKLELFSSCPFSFFVKYGLKATERKLYKITPPDIGSLFHKILELISKSFFENNISWRNVTMHQISKEVETTVDMLVPEISSEILLSSAKYRHFITKIKRVAKRSIWALCEHIKAGSFEPIGYEIGFGTNAKLPPIVIELANQNKIILTGKVDRVDIFDSEGNTYVKIIDYKSGNTKYDLLDIYYGLQLQLLLYLDAVIKSGSKLSKNNLVPGGIFYFSINDPIISINKEMSSQEISTELLKIFKLSGLVLEDKNLIYSMDSSIKTFSKIIPVRMTASNEIVSSNSSTATAKQFDDLRKYVISIIKETGNEIIKGNIKISPFKDKQSSSCDYCIYKSICHIEILNKPNKYRKLKKIDNVFEKINQAVLEQQPPQ